MGLKSSLLGALNWGKKQFYTLFILRDINISVKCICNFSFMRKHCSQPNYPSFQSFVLVNCLNFKFPQERLQPFSYLHVLLQENARSIGTTRAKLRSHPSLTTTFLLAKLYLAPSSSFPVGPMLSFHSSLCAVQV